MFGKLVKEFSDEGRLTPIPETPSTETIEKLVKEVQDIMSKAFEKSCRISRPCKGIKPWWNAKLRQIRTKTKKLYRDARSRKEDEESWNKYKSSLQEYKTEIRRTKWESFKEFSESIQDTSEASRLRKVLSKGLTVPSNIRRSDGSWTETNEETLDLLMHTHFPGCEKYAPQETPENGARTDSDTRERKKIEAESIITRDKVEWAVGSFDPYKSPGPDGISPIMLQKSPMWVKERLTRIFQECLVQGYVPERWREVRVVFIPKAGKPSHTTPKDYRPISLSSFLLKTLERLVDAHIKGTTDIENKCTTQHAYLKGKSVESALHEVTRTIEKSLQEKEYTLAAFLDIEGAFSNIETTTIKRSLEQLEVGQMTTEWIIRMLESRIIISEVGNSTTKRRTTKGTPQGGVISPLLWITAINEILLRFKSKGIKVIAYADDVVILITGKDLPTIRDIMEKVLKELAKWAKENGLGANPDKTELILFTRKYKIPKFTPPKMEGKVLTLSKETKYLGIILDSKLSWKRNVEERMKKGINALYACRKLFGKRWGLQPRIVHWMYTAIVRPTITYGSMIWWEAMNKGTNRQCLAKVQRLAALGTTGASRSTAQAALEAILDLQPVETLVKELAAKGALRMRESNLWRPMNYGHSSILAVMGKMIGKEKSGLLTRPTDYLTAKINHQWKIEVNIPTVEEWDNNTVLKEQEISVYTDASISERGTGIGIFSKDLNIEESKRLKNGCGILQAEIYAIGEAARLMQEGGGPKGDVTIYTDSQTAIKCIKARKVKSKAVMNCQEALSWIRNGKIRLCWVPAHKNVEGNMIADRLAKLGAGKAEAEANSPLPTINSLKEIITTAIREKQRSAWEDRKDCTIARQIWPKMDEAKSKRLTELSKNLIRVATGVITDRCPVGKNLLKWKKSKDDLCKECNEEEETIEHLLCKCPALKRQRLKHLGQCYLEELDEVSNIDIKEVAKFASNWKCYTAKN